MAQVGLKIEQMQLLMVYHNYCHERNCMTLRTLISISDGGFNFCVFLLHECHGKITSHPKVLIVTPKKRQLICHYVRRILFFYKYREVVFFFTEGSPRMIYIYIYSLVFSLDRPNGRETGRDFLRVRTASVRFVHQKKDFDHG